MMWKKMMWEKILERKVSGSISVFLAYLVVFVLAVVFALLEVSRVWGLEQRAETDIVMTGNSLFAGYSAELWEEYGLLFLDGSDGQGRLKLSELQTKGEQYAAENLDVHGGESGKIQAQTWNLYGLHPMKLDILSYGLATDQRGSPFRKEAVKIMKCQIAEDLLQELYERVTGKEESGLAEVDVQETTREVALAENPMDVVEQMKQGGILGYVTEDSSVSNKSVDLSSALSARELEIGTRMAQETGSDWREKLLFRLYLEKYFLCYLDDEDDHALDYEMEYLVAGKSSDKANLQSVVNRLVAMRELANLQYLKTDVEKQEIVLAAASALGAATLTPELIPAYKTGIMAAWAYAESVSDVRLLLAGEKVGLIKTKSQWHTDLNGLNQSTDGIAQTEGLSYQEYLQILLWTTGDYVLSYRAMDLIEQNTGYNMNCQIYYLSAAMEYQASPLFLSLISLGQGDFGRYRYQKTFAMSYVQD